ncbi:hypothetical protein CG709_14265, partial [Lachnotalea glycerini]
FFPFLSGALFFFVFFWGGGAPRVLPLSFRRPRRMCLRDRDGNGYVHSDAVKAAGVIELIHLASLVHDDIIDNADIRRGKPTLQNKYGKRTAVICGDYLLSLALKMASEANDKNRGTEIDFPDYISRICLGELEQHTYNRYSNHSTSQYVKIISGKTAPENRPPKHNRRSRR